MPIIYLWPGAAYQPHILAAFRELPATSDFTQLLHISANKPTEKKPLDLTPLGVPPTRSKKVLSGDSDSKDSADENDDDDTDDESGPMAQQQTPADFVGPKSSEEAQMMALSAFEAARYSALCEDYENLVKELADLPAPVATGPSPPVSVSPPTAAAILTPIRSEIIDATGKLSISKMLQARLHWQAGTTTRSEKVSQIDSKYALSRIVRAAQSARDDDTEPEKMTLQEGSNLT
ncbi:hypothetical protein K438DRAFT_1766110 [Mycena galopus ATCC 62051]|nr:hypothetical protein K438DRAFT_1766110 [Mycena galopus ATCC 62051]